MAIEMGTQSAQAQFRFFGPGQNDNSQGNNNNQGAAGGFCPEVARTYKVIRTEKHPFLIFV